MAIGNKILAIIAACVVAAGCSANDRREPEISGGDAPMPSRIDDIAKTESPPPLPADVAQERACGAFIVVERVSAEVASPTPVPVSQAHPGRGALIGLANALNQVDRRGLSRQMNAALNAHSVALTNLGALINHGASRDDIASMAAVTKATGSTVTVLCDP